MGASGFEKHWPEGWVGLRSGSRWWRKGKSWQAWEQALGGKALALWDGEGRPVWLPPRPASKRSWWDQQGGPCFGGSHGFGMTSDLLEPSVSSPAKGQLSFTSPSWGLLWRSDQVIVWKYSQLEDPITATLLKRNREALWYADVHWLPHCVQNNWWAEQKSMMVLVWVVYETHPKHR